ncbi:MAG: O-antigen ligase family protein [Clostridia bacterium]|nr:O-antigen ligase family protein [Clostridia bacterium]
MDSSFTPDKITSVYLASMFTVFLLGFGDGGYANIAEAKLTLFFVINILYILSIALSCRFLKNNGIEFPRKNFAPIKKAAYIFAALYSLFTVVSAVISPHFPSTLIGASRYEGALTITTYCVIFILVSEFARPTKKLYFVFCAAVILFDFICILQLFGLNPLYLYPSGMNYYDAGVRYLGAYIGTIGNADFTAAFLCLSLPLFVFMINRQNKPQFIVSVSAFTLSLIVLIKINVSAALLGIFAAVLLMIPLLFKFTKKLCILYFAVVILLALTAFIIIRSVDFKPVLLHELHMILNGTFSDAYGSGRIGIWRNVIGVIADAPVFGKGPDTMIFEDIAPFTQYLPSTGKEVTSNIDSAHNEYLNILYHQGVIGLISYLGLLGSVFAFLIKGMKRNRLSAALGICAAAYCVQAFFGISTVMSASFFWICLGLICSDTGEAAFV